MSLRKKILLPLLVISLLLGGYLYAFWVPRSLANAEAAYLKSVERHVDTVVESLIPLMIGEHLDIIRETLRGLGKISPDWVSIQLFDSQGRQLYPLLSAAEPALLPGHPIRVVEKAIHFAGTPLGSFVVQIDLTATLRRAQEEYQELATTLAAMVTAVVLTLLFTLEVAVRKPLGSLVVASKALAEQDYDTPLPRIGTDEVGRLMRSFATMRDTLRRNHADLLQQIGEREQAERALRLLNETLEQRVQEEVSKNREKDHVLIQQSRFAAMGEIIHNIAHQWRQPLTALSLVISNIKDDYDHQELTAASLDAAVQKSQHLIHRMSVTIDDFRNFFRTDLKTETFDFKTAVEEALALIEPTLASEHIETVRSLSAGLPVNGGCGQLAQALLNLLTNAREAIQRRSPDGGRVEIRLERRDHCAELVIADDGGGIPEQVLPKIFDPYFTTKDQGSGIGLYMSKIIVERNLQGSIEASNSGPGARFVVVLPLLAESSLLEDAAADPQQGPKTSLRPT